MSYVNLLTVMYPIGSLYFSTTSTSPANIIGGTWSQITGAVIAATGENSFANAASYGGNLAISLNQIPRHNHSSNDDRVLINVTPTGSLLPLDYALGGSAIVSQGKLFTSYVGNGEDFIPYHFSVYVWYRTA